MPRAPSCPVRNPADVAAAASNGSGAAAAGAGANSETTTNLGLGSVAVEPEPEPELPEPEPEPELPSDTHHHTHHAAAPPGPGPMSGQPDQPIQSAADSISRFNLVRDFTGGVETQRGEPMRASTQAAGVDQYREPPTIDDGEIKEDDEVRDGCNQCPPTWKATRTFVCHLAKAIFPFFFLAQLFGRWVLRKFNYLEAEKQGVTARKMVDFTGWFGYFFLVYLVMTHSSTMHAWVKEWTGTLGEQERAGWRFFLGDDPYDKSKSFVDGALSESYFPILAYIMLAVLWSHEETSYPWRTKMQYTMEQNSSALVRGLQWIEHNTQMAKNKADPNYFKKSKMNLTRSRAWTSAQDYLKDDTSAQVWLQDDNFCKRKFFPFCKRMCCAFDSMVLSVGGILFMLGCEVFILYLIQFSLNSDVGREKLFGLADSYFVVVFSGCWLGIAIIVGKVVPFFRPNYEYSWILRGSTIFSTFVSVQAFAVFVLARIFDIGSDEYALQQWSTWLTSFGMAVWLGSILMAVVGVFIISIAIGDELGCGKWTDQQRVQVEHVQGRIALVSFQDQNYTERYNKQFRELECTPIQGCHFADATRNNTWAHGEMFSTEQAPFFVFFKRLIKVSPGGISSHSPEPLDKIDHKTTGTDAIIDQILQTRDQMQDGKTKPLYADQVTTMIRLLSKARQLKKRFFWRRKLWYISIVHALIPSLYTFAYTSPWVFLRYCLWLVVAFAVTSLGMFSPDHIKAMQQQNAVAKIKKKMAGLNVNHHKSILMEKMSVGDVTRPSVCAAEERVHDLEQEEREHIPMSQTCRGFVTLHARRIFKVVVAFALVLVLLLGCHEGAGPRFSKYYWDSQHTDQCGDILDTQGHCCCNVSVWDKQHHPVALEETAIWKEVTSYGNDECCESEFVQGGRLIKPSKTRSCRTRKIDCSSQNQLFNVYNLNNNSHARESMCIDQEWLDKGRARMGIFDFSGQSSASAGLSGVIRQATKDRSSIAGWCSRFSQDTVTHISDSAERDANESLRCIYAVSNISAGHSACSVPFVDVTKGWFLWIPFQQDQQELGCLACGSTLWAHICNFLANTVLTYAVVRRIYRCYEDYFLQYHRMLYCLQLVPWSTMASILKEKGKNDLNSVVLKHESWGLLPTFDLSSASNITAWNKMRLFLASYEKRASRRLQVSVIYILAAWVITCVYQSVKFVRHAGEQTIDTEAVFVLSSTLMLAVGLAAILFAGKDINDIGRIGFPHVLRVKQAELLDKTSNFLVEYDFWNGKTLHDQHVAGHARACRCEHHLKDEGGKWNPGYQQAEKELLRVIKTKAMSYNPELKTMYDPDEATTGPEMSPLRRQDSRFTKAFLEKHTQHAAIGPGARQQHLDEEILRIHAARTQLTAEDRAAATHRWQLLENLIHTIEAEHGEGSRKHWGAEDRRTQLWFIVMTEGTIKGFATALLSGVAPFIIHALEQALE